MRQNPNRLLLDYLEERTLLAGSNDDAEKQSVDASADDTKTVDKNKVALDSSDDKQTLDKDKKITEKKSFLVKVGGFFEGLFKKLVSGVKKFGKMINVKAIFTPSNLVATIGEIEKVAGAVESLVSEHKAGTLTLSDVIDQVKNVAPANALGLAGSLSNALSGTESVLQLIDEIKQNPGALKDAAVKTSIEGLAHNFEFVNKAMDAYQKLSPALQKKFLDKAHDLFGDEVDKIIAVAESATENNTFSGNITAIDMINDLVANMHAAVAAANLTDSTSLGGLGDEPSEDESYLADDSDADGIESIALAGTGETPVKKSSNPFKRFANYVEKKFDKMTSHLSEFAHSDDKLGFFIDDIKAVGEKIGYRISGITNAVTELHSKGDHLLGNLLHKVSNYNLKFVHFIQEVTTYSDAKAEKVQKFVHFLSIVCKTSAAVLGAASPAFPPLAGAAAGLGVASKGLSVAEPKVPAFLQKLDKAGKATAVMGEMISASMEADATHLDEKSDALHKKYLDKNAARKARHEAHKKARAEKRAAAKAAKAGAPAILSGAEIGSEVLAASISAADSIGSETIVVAA